MILFGRHIDVQGKVALEVFPLGNPLLPLLYLQLSVQLFANFAPPPAFSGSPGVLRVRQIQWSHRAGPVVLVDGDEGQETCVRVPFVASEEILGFHENTDLHGRTADEVHSRRARHELTCIDRLHEVDAIDRDGDGRTPGMAHRSNRRSPVYHREQFPTKNMAEIVDLVRHHQL